MIGEPEMEPFTTGKTEASEYDFPYEQLLAYYRGEIVDPVEAAWIEERLRTSDRWTAHWRSMEYLDLERVAAIQDATDLGSYSPPQDPEQRSFCNQMAESEGTVLRPMLQGLSNEMDVKARRAWSAHCQQCVFCRRMRRRMYAVESQKNLPKNEPLLRDWLLEEYYREALHAARQRILGSERNEGESTSGSNQTPTILFQLAEGVIKAMQVSGSRENLNATPIGQVLAWSYHAHDFRPGRRQLVDVPLVLAGKPERMALELERSLGEKRGTLKIRFDVLDGGDVLGTFSLTRPDQEPTVFAPVMLMVEVQGAPVIKATQTIKTFSEKAILGNTHGLPDKTIHVLVRQGDERWEDCFFKFEEGA